MQKTTELKLEIGDLVQWVDPLYDIFEETRDNVMKVYGIVVGFNKEVAKVFWFDKLDMNSYFMESDQIILISKHNKTNKTNINSS
jgi:hypothetical protein